MRARTVRGALLLLHPPPAQLSFPQMPIPVIDLFAGPGGLGEGFSSLRRDNEALFKVKLAIKKDPHAHQTPQLRAFYRQFPHGQAPETYYNYLFRLISREDLFAKYPCQAKRAAFEARHAELGSPDFPNALIDEHIRTALGSQINGPLIGGPRARRAFSQAVRPEPTTPTLERTRNSVISGRWAEDGKRRLHDYGTTVGVWQLSAASGKWPAIGGRGGERGGPARPGGI